MTLIDRELLLESIARFVSDESSTFIWGNADEPEGDIYIASKEFVDIVVDEYERRIERKAAA